MTARLAGVVRHLVPSAVVLPLVVAALVPTLAPAPVPAQVSTQGRIALDLDVRARVQRMSGEVAIIEVEEDSVLRSGDAIQVRVTPRHDAYVYLLAYGSTDSALLLHPFSGDDADAFVAAGEERWIPAPDEFLPLDDNLGREALFAVASPEPLEEISRLLVRMEARGDDLRGVTEVVRGRYPEATRVAFKHIGAQEGLAGVGIAPSTSAAAAGTGGAPSRRRAQSGRAAASEAARGFTSESPRPAPDPYREPGVLSASGERLKRFTGEAEPLPPASSEDTVAQTPEEMFARQAQEEGAREDSPRTAPEKESGGGLFAALGSLFGGGSPEEEVASPPPVPEPEPDEPATTFALAAERADQDVAGAQAAPDASVIDEEVEEPVAESSSAGSPEVSSAPAAEHAASSGEGELNIRAIDEIYAELSGGAQATGASDPDPAAPAAALSEPGPPEETTIVAGSERAGETTTAGAPESGSEPPGDALRSTAESEARDAGSESGSGGGLLSRLGSVFGGGSASATRSSPGAGAARDIAEPGGAQAPADEEAASVVEGTPAPPPAAIVEDPEVAEAAANEEAAPVVEGTPAPPPPPLVEDPGVAVARADEEAASVVEGTPAPPPAAIVDDPEVAEAAANEEAAPVVEGTPAPPPPPLVEDPEVAEAAANEEAAPVVEGTPAPPPPAIVGEGVTAESTVDEPPWTPPERVAAGPEGVTGESAPIEAQPPRGDVESEPVAATDSVDEGAETQASDSGGGLFSALGSIFGGGRKARTANEDGAEDAVAPASGEAVASASGDDGAEPPPVEPEGRGAASPARAPAVRARAETEPAPALPEATRPVSADAEPTADQPASSAGEEAFAAAEPPSTPPTRVVAGPEGVTGESARIEAEPTSGDVESEPVAATDSVDEGAQTQASDSGGGLFSALGSIFGGGRKARPANEDGAEDAVAPASGEAVASASGDDGAEPPPVEPEERGAASPARAPAVRARAETEPAPALPEATRPVMAAADPSGADSIAARDEGKDEAARSGGGLLSALGSLFGGGSGEPEEAEESAPAVAAAAGPSVAPGSVPGSASRSASESAADPGEADPEEKPFRRVRKASGEEVVIVQGATSPSLPRRERPRPDEGSGEVLSGEGSRIRSLLAGEEADAGRDTGDDPVAAAARSAVTESAVTEVAEAEDSSVSVTASAQAPEPSVTAAPATAAGGEAAPAPSVPVIAGDSVQAALERGLDSGESGASTIAALTSPAPATTREVEPVREVDVSADEGVAASVVLVVTPLGSASGVIVDDAGHVLTSWHLVDGFPAVSVVRKAPGTDLPAEDELLTARVVRHSKFADLALLEIEDPPRDLRPATLASAEEIGSGDVVHTIGHPTGAAWTHTIGKIDEVKVNSSWFSGRRVLHRGTVLEAKVLDEPGSAGAPLFNNRMELVGLSVRGRIKRGVLTGIAIDSIRGFLEHGALETAAGG